MLIERKSTKSPSLELQEAVNYKMSKLKEMQEDTSHHTEELFEDLATKVEHFFESMSEGFEKFFLN